MWFLCLALLARTDPLTPTQLREALQSTPEPADAAALADRVRAWFPDGTNLKLGQHGPIVDRDLVAFVLESRAPTTPRVVGAINRGRGRDMVRIGQSHLWAWVEPVPRQARFAYRFQVGPREVGGGTVTTPAWKTPPEAAARPGRDYGEYVPMSFRSQVYQNQRTGWVYLPAALEQASEPAALLFVLDGDAYRRAEIGTIVDNLIADDRMPVTVVVGLNPGTNDDGLAARGPEYEATDDRFVRFLDNEVLPRLTDVRVSNDPDDRAILGASAGGRAAFQTAWDHPGLFGRAAAQLGRFTGHRDGLSYPDLVRKADRRPLRLILASGPNAPLDANGDWWEATRALHAVLQEKGHDVHLLEDEGFHNFATVARQLPDVLRRLWSQPSK